MQPTWLMSAVVFAATGWIAAVSLAQETPFYRQGMPLTPGSGGEVALPYRFGDSAGNMWRIFNNGWCQEEGNAPVFNQAAVIYINGSPLGQQNNQGRLDPQTGELVLENLPVNGVTVTRRVLFQKRDTILRYIDILHNTQDQQQTVTVSLTTNLNLPLSDTQLIPDPAKKGQNVAWVAQTAGGPAVVELYGGPGAKVTPTLDFQQGGNAITATLVLNIPAGRELAILHLHRPAASLDAGVRYVSDLKESTLLKTVPTALRKSIVNFAPTGDWIGDVELLRGDLLDAIELRNGDLFRGTLGQSNYALQTFFGPLSIPADSVVGLVNVGEFHPRQLIVTSDGQIFGGRLDKETLDLELTNGQVTHVPISQITRAGYRKRRGEADGWTFNQPLVLLRSGERLLIKPPAANLDVATRYGKLSLKPETVAAISFQNDENGVHEVTLADGSRFSGLMAGDELEVVLETGGRRAKIPAGALVRLQLASKMPEVDDHAAALHLLNDELLVGSLMGKVKIETVFDTVSLSASEIRLLTRSQGKGQEAQAILWDGTTLSGRLVDPELTCQLKCGMTMKVPVAVLVEYSQPPKKGSPATRTAG
ncbi:MAG TPA: hypothetical protein VG269_06040 [Tepidisphaeraceae bacterium]|nr:hypothetical protein [Tepidisphaeraceae bacterium]